MTPNARFEDLLRDIEPSPTTKGRAQSAHMSLRSFLNGHEVFSSCLKSDFLSGSHKRDTAIRPRTKEGTTERPDVDVIVVTHHTTADNPADVITFLHDVLEEKYEMMIRPQSRSVGIKMTTVDMDVVPIIGPFADGLYRIPDRKLETWLPTNPPGHTTWTVAVNDRMGGRFKPLVKLMKWWRRHSRTVSKRPKGFVLECIAAECMDPRETHYGKLFVSTLDTFLYRASECMKEKVVPFLPDPAVPGNSVMDGMTFAAFEGFYNKAAEHAEIGHKALEVAEQGKATELWRRIFGERFPGPVGEAPSLLRAGSALGGLSFPNRPVQPPRKPQGFA